MNDSNSSSGGSASSTKMSKRIRRAAILSSAGLGVQLVAALHWTPLTFIVASALGAPLVIAGALQFAAAVWRNMKDKGAV